MYVVEQSKLFGGTVSSQNQFVQSYSKPLQKSKHFCIHEEYTVTISQALQALPTTVH